MILLRLASTTQNEISEVNIISEFPMSKTTFETTSGPGSFSGVVDFLLASVPPEYSCKVFISTPSGSCLQLSRLYTLKYNLPAAVPQAAMTVALYCKQHRPPVLRGCITSGEEWAFFVYKDGAPGASSQVSLTDLLRNLVENALVHDQKY
ncbi:hypothetical protein AX15_000806 [Amanita polypyramis BW_CC]|nr:hypothetical protein AX15_000806 [Amanita polypyramis BW_CC]